jgi:hypothetical protein
MNVASRSSSPMLLLLLLLLAPQALVSESESLMVSYELKERSKADEPAVTAVNIVCKRVNAVSE